MKPQSNSSKKSLKRAARAGRVGDIRRMLRNQRKELIDLNRFQTGINRTTCRVSFAENIRAQQLHPAIAGDPPRAIATIYRPLNPS